MKELKEQIVKSIVDFIGTIYCKGKRLTIADLDPAYYAEFKIALFNSIQSYITGKEEDITDYLRDGEKKDLIYIGVSQDIINILKIKEN